MKLSVYNIKGKETSKSVNLDKEIFGVDPNTHAIYLDVKNYLAAQRQGTHKSKERGEIKGSKKTKKTKRFWSIELAILKTLYLEGGNF